MHSMYQVRENAEIELRSKAYTLFGADTVVKLNEDVTGRYMGVPVELTLQGVALQCFQAANQ